ncbi:MAG TPA: AAA family ATPase [Solirubrobacteraceae bacterium]
MPLTTEVIGRAAELEAADRFLDALADGPAALVFEGDPGIGKTTLLRATEAMARRRGMRVVSCVASASETPLSYSALADLFEGSVALGPLPPAQSRALNGALSRDGGDLTDADPRAVATAVLSVLQRPDREPLVVVIDDLQSLDRATAQVLEFCARRVTGPVGLATSRRPATGRDAARLDLRLREPERLELRRLAPLDLSTLRQVLRRRSRRPLARRTVERIHDASGGNPFYALELARAVHPEAPAPSALPLSTTLQEIVDGRLAGLGADLEQALLAVAALAAPTVELLVQALGPGAEVLLEDAEHRGILERAGRRLAFTHPLLSNGVLARASSEERRAMHARLSSVVPDLEERARHLAHARVLPDALSALDEAAHYVRARGAPAAAAELLDLALGLGGGHELRVRAAEHHLDAGDAARAQELLDEAVPTLPSGAARARALLLLAEIRYQDDSYPEARALLEEARVQEGVDQRLRVMIDLRLGFVLSNLGCIAAAEGPARSALAGAAALGNDALRAEALALSAGVDFALGLGVRDAPLGHALDLESPDVRTTSVLRPSLVAAQLYLWAARLDDSRELLAELRRRHAERGEDFELAWVCYGLAWLEGLGGDLAAASAAADEAHERLVQLGTRHGRALGLAARASVDAYSGRVYEARQRASEAIALFERGGWHTASWRPLATLGFLDLSVGDYGAAAEKLGPVALEAVAGGLAAPVTWGGSLSYSDAAEALVGVGRLEQAERLIAVLERRGSAPSGAWPRGQGARCRGLLLAARGELPAAEQMLQRGIAAHAGVSIPMERARGLLALGRVQRRRRKRLAANATLTHALAIFEAIGSPLWADQARAELARITLPPGGPNGLTASEERVARLAASGLTNREVAQRVHLSTRTVELRLRRAYRKLGISSRAELGAHMALHAASHDESSHAA